jgi:hypothetical protein
MSIRSQLVRTLVVVAAVVVAATLIIPKTVLAPSPIKFSGVITKVNGDTFEVFTNPNADPQSAYKKERKLVRFDADTVFQSSEKRDLRVGREVQTVGLGLRNGIVKATRVTICEGKRPVRMGKGKVIAPDGTISVIDR